MNRTERESVWHQLRELYDAREAYRWMISRHPQLDDRRPTDCRYDEVLAVIDRTVRNV